MNDVTSITQTHTTALLQRFMLYHLYFQILCRGSCLAILVISSLTCAFVFGSHLSAITEKITGRDEDTCPDSTGNAKNDMGDARMDIFRSEIACEDTCYNTGSS